MSVVAGFGCAEDLVLGLVDHLVDQHVGDEPKPAVGVAVAIRHVGMRPV